MDYNRSFAFRVQTNLRYGAGECLKVPGILKQMGFSSVGLIVDEGARSNPAFVELRKAIEGDFEVRHEYVHPPGEPDYDLLDQVSQGFRNLKLDVIITVGGGSAIDVAKAVSVLMTNPGPAISYRGFDKVQNPGVPLIALPTTAGTGSEVTPNAVFTEKTENRKFGINTPLYLPKLAILDPRLTLTCPPKVTISAGMDALVHAVEAYVARSTTPTARLFAREAFQLGFAALPRVVEKPNELELRGKMQLAAFYAGVALPNSGPGPAGAMSYPLGAHFRVPHGIAGAVFLEPVARFNVDRGCHLYAGLLDGREASSKDGAKRFCNELARMTQSIGVPSALTEFGVSPKDVEKLAKESFDLKGAMEQNPIEVKVDDIRKIIASLVPGA